MRLFPVAMLLSTVVINSTALGAEPKITIKDFYGTYVGVGATRSRGIAQRDRAASLEIAPADDGFRIEWSTTIDKGSKENKRTNSESLTFRPSGRPGRWRAVESGDPFNRGFISWARLEGRNLFVYVFAVDPKSGELTAAIWRRTLTSKGLRVRYDRIRDARRVRGAFAWTRRKK